MKKIVFLALAVLMVVSLASCGGQNDGPSESTPPINSDPDSSSTDTPNNAIQSDTTEESEAGGPQNSATELIVHFGDDGAPFTMVLEDNETAAAIADYVGSADWRLPIYNYDNFDGWEFMQYYDIPSRYDIPSDPTTVTEGKAGEVYYSDPNRIVLFYHGGAVSGEYTKVGTFDATEEFTSAVEQNPVLDGRGNKIVVISAAE